MREQYKQVLSDRINAVHQDLAERLAEPLQRMSKGLDYNEGEKPSGFRDTLVDNVLSIVDLMRTCNLNGNAHIAGIQQDLRATLKGVTPDGLRRDPNLRADTKRKVDAIIKNLRHWASSPVDLTKHILIIDIVTARNINKPQHKPTYVHLYVANH